MLRGNKPEETLRPSNRTKLPLESGIRSFKGIKELLSAAEANKGKQIELEWTTGTPGQSFVLDVQWDVSSEDPIWSLYEESNGGSKKLWSQPFAAIDLELFYDVLVMSCGAPTTSSSKKLSEILKPKVTEDKDGQSKFVGPDGKDKSPADGKNEGSATNNAEEKPTAGAPAAAIAPAPANLPNQQVAQYPPPGYPPYNMAPGMPPGFPMPYPPMMPPGQGYMTPPVMPPPGWTYTPVSPDNTGQMMAAMPNPYAQNAQHMPPAQQQSIASSLPIDSALVNKNYEMSLINLLKQAELITKPTLDATIKIQNLIQDGTVPFGEGIKILKQHHQKGDSIDTVVHSGASGGEVPYKEPSIASAGMSKGKPASKEKAAAFELLEKAGLLTTDDLNTAKNVVRKHGGELLSILKAAQKIDDKTFEAAVICVSLLEEDLMKVEQCIIALNYCSRSRVGFDEAMDELSWPNPRH